MGHFNIAYNVYNFLLQLSTAGFPLALSKLTSEALALGRGNQVRRQFRVAAALFFVLGLAASAVMFFGAMPLAELMNDSLAYYPIKVLAPAVFFVCLIGCCRGYTQGRGNMVPTAASQVLEALCKLVVGLGLAWYVLRVLHVNVEIGAAAAIFGVTVGSAAAVLFLAVWLLRHRLSGRFEDRSDGGGAHSEAPAAHRRAHHGGLQRHEHHHPGGSDRGHGPAAERPGLRRGRRRGPVRPVHLRHDAVQPAGHLRLSRHHQPDPGGERGADTAQRAARPPADFLILPAHRHAGAAGGRRPFGAGGADPAAALSRRAGHGGGRHLSPADPGRGGDLRVPDDLDQRDPAGLRPGVSPHRHRRSSAAR